MKIIFRMKRISAFVFFSFIVIPALFSQQTRNDAIIAFNKGLEAKQAENYDEALAKFNEAIKIANEVGEDAEDVVLNVQSQIPAVYYQMAMALYNKKEIDKAIDKFKETIDAANKYSDPDMAKKASNAISQLYYFKGATSYQNANYEEALGFFNQSIEYYPDNYKAFYMIAASYKSLDDDEKLYDAAKKAADVAKANSDNKYYENSLKLAGDYFLLKGNNAKKAEKYDNAIKYLNYSLEFDPENKDAYLLLLQIYNAQSNWDKAIDAANKALEYEKDDPTQKAGIYYELGNALKNKGETESACNAYKNAAVGAFKESSEYIIEHELNCQ